jgi:hypothetical protein
MSVGWSRGALCSALVVIAALSSSCAASRALNEPTQKDYDVLKPGTNVDLVRSELGEPLKSGRDNCDVFVFDEGSSGWRYLRAMGYSILDVGTLGVSEIVTNPLEASVGRDRVRLRVCYDPEHNVAYSERLEIGKSPELISGAYRSPQAGRATPESSVQARD